MVIDCHYHLETRMQSIENLILKMELNGIEKTALIPIICDVPPELTSFTLKLFHMILFHKLTRPFALKFVSSFTPEGDLILQNKHIKLYKDFDNESVAKAIKSYPDKFYGWIFVNPKGNNDQVDEYNKWRRYSGFIGVKAHPYWNQYQLKELLPVAHLAAQDGRPLLIHAGLDDDDKIEAFTKAVPNLKLILAHAGFPGYSDTWRKVCDNENVFVDLCANAYVNEKTTKQAVDYLGAERCLFGTDGPYGFHSDDGFFDNGFIKRRIELLFQDQGIQNKILGDNFRKLIPV